MSQAQPVQELIQAGSIRLNVASMGQGSPIVLLHGFPQTNYCWRKVMPSLAENYRVIAPDLRGYGLSDKPKTGYDKKTLAADLGAMLDTLGIDKIVLVGHDWGGGVAYRFALDYTERVEKLVIINMIALHIPRLPRLIQILRSYYIYLFQIPSLPERLISRYSRQFFSRLFEDTAYNAAAFSEEDIDYYVGTFSEAESLRGPIGFYRQMFWRDIRDLWPHLGRVLDLPHLIIWGEKDKFLDVKMIEGLDKYFTDLTIRTIPDSGHWVPDEKPELVVECIKEFVEGRTGAA